MKLLVIAQIPPPSHGQSVMVKAFLDGLRSPPSRIQPIHLNYRFSKSIEEVGKGKIRKFLYLLKYGALIILRKIRNRPEAVYYVPAPAQKVPLIRDLATLFLVRMLFKKVIFHWHAVGLGAWYNRLETTSPSGRILKKLCRFCYGGVDLSIALSRLTQEDALYFQPKKVIVVYNGIEDPCPDFTASILPRREKQLENRRLALEDKSKKEHSFRFSFLFISLCTREKGLFDAFSGLQLLSKRLRARNPSFEFTLKIAGVFPHEAEEKIFLKMIEKQSDVAVERLGFVEDEKKKRLFLEADCLLFPTFYGNENLPLVLLEALAFGLPVLATAWRGIPEILGEDYPFTVGINNPEGIANTLEPLLNENLSSQLRNRYLDHFTITRFIEKAKAAVLSVFP